MISGDPHTHTFDMKHMSFQGTCKYVAASLQENNEAGLPPFTVYNKNERRGDNIAVAYLKYTEVHVFGHVIRLARSNVVTVIINKFCSFCITNEVFVPFSLQQSYLMFNKYYIHSNLLT